MTADIVYLFRDPVVRRAFERAKQNGGGPITVENYFGGCPTCGKTDGYRNIGREHWDSCAAHRVKWRIGANLFSCWRDETDEVWQRNAAALADYAAVEPLPCTSMPIADDTAVSAYDGFLADLERLICHYHETGLSGRRLQAAVRSHFTGLDFARQHHRLDYNRCAARAARYFLKVRGWNPADNAKFRPLYKSLRCHPPARIAG